MGYVWCEIRQQSSEEPCDETSFGKKKIINVVNSYLPTSLDNPVPFLGFEAPGLDLLLC